MKNKNLQDFQFPAQQHIAWAGNCHELYPPLRRNF